VTPSPWLTLSEIADYMKKGRRFVRREITAGRLRAARIGARGNIRGRAEWCDEYMFDQERPAPVVRLRKGA
jgi:excisionase family DNA binding protein